MNRIVENFIISLVLVVAKVLSAYICVNTKLIFKAPYEVRTLDMSLSKQITNSGAGSSSGHNYEVLHSQTQKNSF
jgi:hypothetical protein